MNNNEEVEVFERGNSLHSTYFDQRAQGTQNLKPDLSLNQTGGMVCPKCGGNHVLIQTIQENQGSTSVSKTKSVYREKGHGIIWWLTIGWWWWAFDLCLWVFAFFPRLILRLLATPFRRRKIIGSSTTVETTKNKIVYKTICTCQNCGHIWKKGFLR